MRKRINILLGSLIALVSGCTTPKKAAAEMKVVALYGVPYATYDISGTVTKKQKPAKGIPVVVKGNQNHVIGDTLYTDNKGQFHMVKADFPTVDIQIVAHDPHTLQPTDSVQLTAEYDRTPSARGFDRGLCTVKVEIELQDKSNQ